MLGFVGNGGFHKFLAIIATFVIIQVVIKPQATSFPMEVSGLSKFESSLNYGEIYFPTAKKV